MINQNHWYILIFIQIFLVNIYVDGYFEVLPGTITRRFRWHLHKVKGSIIPSDELPRKAPKYVSITKPKSLPKKKRSPRLAIKELEKKKIVITKPNSNPFSTISSWLPGYHSAPEKNKLVTIDRSMPAELLCEHFDICDGCAYDRGLNSTPIMIQAQTMLPLEVKLGQIYGWRTLAKLAVMPQHKYSGIKLGLYARNSHIVMPIPKCAVHHPSINAAVAAIEEATLLTKISAFRNETKEGMIRYVQLAVERSTGKVQATFVWNADSFREASPHPQRLMKLLKLAMDQNKEKIFHSLWLNFNTREGNAIFNRDVKNWHRCHGPEFVCESLFDSLDDFKSKSRTNEHSTPFLAMPKKPEVKAKQVRDMGTGDAISTSKNNTKPVKEYLPQLYFSPMVFRQANLDAFADIIARLARPDGIQRNDVICELYAGIGMISLSLMIKGGSELGGGAASVRCSDDNPSNQRAFEFSKKSLPKKLRDHCHFEAKSASEAISDGLAFGANVLIVDPPRHGVDQDVFNALVDFKDPRLATIERLIYISCNFLAIQVQLPAFLKAGWRLDFSEAYALFPGSDHVETLVVLSRPPPFLKDKEFQAQHNASVARETEKKLQQLKQEQLPALKEEDIFSPNGLSIDSLPMDLTEDNEIEAPVKKPRKPSRNMKVWRREKAEKRLQKARQRRKLK